ncbi:MAG: ABC transporter substrate-binding protein [Spirochaetota bacterium]
MKCNIAFVFLSTVLVIFFSTCDYYTYSSKKRAELASSGENDIHIAIVDSSNFQGQFLLGVKLALKELNLHKSLPKPIRASYLDDGGSIEEGRKIARDLSSEYETIAVIGHQDSNIAIASSIIYEASGLLFISPRGMQSELIKSENNFTFRNFPSDREITQESAQFAIRNKYQKMVIVYDRDNTTKRYAELFQKYATDVGVKIVSVKSYSSWEKDYRKLISEILQGKELDAILLSGTLPSAGEFIKQARNIGIAVPILTGPFLDTAKLWKFIGEKPKEIIVPTPFNPDLPGNQTRSFVKKFRQAYDSTPDTAAAQGYDAVNLLATSIQKSQSYVPIVLSKTIGFLQNWEGVTGLYSFQTNGSLRRKPVYFKAIDGDKFRFLESDLLQGAINPFDTTAELGKIRIAIKNDDISLDPAFATGGMSGEINEQLFLGLTDIDPNNYSVVPELASSWTVGEDGKTYVFKLREDAKWRNGESVKASDIEFAINRNLDPSLEVPGVESLFVLKNARKAFAGRLRENEKVGAEALDEYTIQFTLAEKASDFPALVGTGVYKPLPEKVVTQFPKRWLELANLQTNGSYYPVLWKKGLALVLKKNDRYYDAKQTRIREVRYLVINDDVAGLAMFKNNQLDIFGGNFLPISSKLMKLIKSDKKLFALHQTRSDLSTYGLLYNTNLVPLDNLDVRKAISTAINRVLITKLVVQGEHKASRLFSPELLVKNNGNVSSFGIGYDPFVATKLLASGGYNKGIGFPVITLGYTRKQDKRVAVALKKSLKHILNINISLVYARSAEQQANSHLALVYKKADFFGPGYFVRQFFNPADSPYLAGSVSSPLKDIFASAEETLGIEQRSSLYQNAEKLITDDLCLGVAIYNGYAHYLVNARVSGWNHQVIGGQKIRDWNLSQ